MRKTPWKSFADPRNNNDLTGRRGRLPARFRDKTRIQEFGLRDWRSQVRQNRMTNDSELRLLCHKREKGHMRCAPTTHHHPKLQKRLIEWYIHKLFLWTLALAGETVHR